MYIKKIYVGYNVYMLRTCSLYTQKTRCHA